MHITGEPDGSPMKTGFAVIDVLTSQQLMSGILGAILHKERTGHGQHVVTSMLESSLFSLSYVTSSWLNGQVDYTRMGNVHPNISPYSVYKTKCDQWIVIGVATDE